MWGIATVRSACNRRQYEIPLTYIGSKYTEIVRARGSDDSMVGATFFDDLSAMYRYLVNGQLKDLIFWDKAEPLSCDQTTNHLRSTGCILTKSSYS